MAKEYIERELVENIFREKQQKLLNFKRYSQFDRDEKEEYDCLEDYRDQINALPPADVVEVVRCKDCEFCQQNSYTKNYICTSMTNPNIVQLEHFCSHGLRKDGAE